MVPLITARLDGPEEAALRRAETLAHVTMACLDVAMSQWVRLDGSEELATPLDATFDQLVADQARPGTRPRPSPPRAAPSR